MTHLQVWATLHAYELKQAEIKKKQGKWKESETEDTCDDRAHDVMRLTSAPWDRLRFLRAGEGSAERRGVGPPFFNCCPEGDFGTVHTGTPSEKRQGVRAVCCLPQSKNGGDGRECVIYIVTLWICAYLYLNLGWKEIDKERGRRHITADSFLIFNIRAQKWIWNEAVWLSETRQQEI